MSHPFYSWRLIALSSTDTTKLSSCLLCGIVLKRLQKQQWKTDFLHRKKTKFKLDQIYTTPYYDNFRGAGQTSATTRPFTARESNPESQHIHTLRFNGHFSRWTWVSRLPPLIFLLHLFLDCTSFWDRPKLAQEKLHKKFPENSDRFPEDCGRRSKSAPATMRPTDR